MNQQINWKASETCVTAPWPFSDRGFAGVKFRLDASESPAVDANRRIESVEEWDRLAPELFLDVDRAALADDTGLPADAIIVSVIVRDRDLNKFQKVSSWPLNDLPRDTWSLTGVLDGFSRSARLDVSVVASPVASVDRPESTRIPKGAAVAVKTFRIRVPDRGLDLPVVLVEPDAMEGAGLDRNTACYVHWKGEDMQRAPADLIEVWLNKDYEDKFRALSSDSANAGAVHIAQNIAAHVYASVLACVLGADADAGAEPGSLVGVVGDVIERRLQMTLDDARRVYREGPAGAAKLLPWCWKLTGADKAFATLQFRRTET